MTEIENSITSLEHYSGFQGKGSYILLIELREEQTIAVGSFKTIRFPAGYYAYIGSAMGGFKARLGHHLKGEKKLRWHIDYLLPVANISDIILCPTLDRAECAIALSLGHHLEAIPGFGSSDCKCCSHLFFAPGEKVIKSQVLSSITSLKIKPAVLCQNKLAGLTV